MAFAMSHLANATAKKVSLTHGFEGDGAESLGTAFSCRFRGISTTSEASPGGATVKAADAMLWCDTSVSLSEDDIIEVNGDRRYQVIRYIPGTAEDSDQFKKFELQRYRG